MDAKFQSSFIPRKILSEPGGHPRSERVGIFLIVAIVIFIVALSAAGGVFVYKRVLIDTIVGKNASLVEAKNSFEQSLIDTANAMNKRIEAAKKLLAAHTVVSPVFNFLENDTLATVRFDSLVYEARDNGGVYLSLNGQAKNFNSVALQSDIFGQEKFIKNPVFSDLNPDQSGNIVFKFNSSVDPSFVSYKKNLPVAAAADTTQTP